MAKIMEVSANLCMKRILSMFLSIALVLTVIISIPSVSAEMHNSGIETVITMANNSKKTIKSTVNLSKDGYKFKNAEELELKIHGEEILKVTLDGNGSNNSSYLSVLFPVPETSEEAFFTGLTIDNVNEVQSKLISAYTQNDSFKISDLSFIDAEKTSNADGDDQLCWAATASNMLELTGWARKSGFESEDDLFETFIDNFSNDPGNVFYGLAWFFNGVNLNSNFAQIKNYPNSGAYLANYPYSTFCNLKTLDEYTKFSQTISLLSSGYGVGLGINMYNTMGLEIGGHAVTMMGYVVDKSYAESDINYYKYVMISDSDSDELLDQDRRQSENIVTAYKLQSFQNKNKTVLGFQYGSIPMIINGYQSLAPYTPNFGEEKSSKATKNLRTTTDISISDIYIGKTPGNQNHDNVFNNSDTIYFTPVFLNDSDVVVPENSEYDFKLKLLNKNNNKNVSEESFQVPFDGMGVMNFVTFIPEDYIELSELSVGDYTLTLTLSPPEGMEEAYLVNNVLKYDFSVIDPNATEPVTEEPTQTPTEAQKAIVTIYGFDGESDTREFNVGDTFTVYNTLNTSAYGGEISNFGAEQTYTNSVLEVADKYKIGFTETNEVFPVTKAFTISIVSPKSSKNPNLGLIYYNMSTPNSYTFDDDGDVLIKTKYTVTSSGTAEIRNNLITLTLANDNLTKIVTNGQISTGYEDFRQHASYELTEPSTQEPTETPTESPTEAPTEAPHVHTPAEAVKENETQATCKKAGSYDEVVYCSTCGEELSRTTKTIEKLAHTPAEAVRENEKAATCIAKGSYDKVVYCSVCGAEISRDKKDIAALGHDLVHHNAKAAACTEKGWKAYDTCKRCDYTTYEEIPAKGHTKAEAVQENRVEATCKKAGSYDEVVYCSVCGDELSRTKKDISKLPHTHTTVHENHSDPSCTEKGGYDKVDKCSVCGEEFSRERITINELGHNFKFVPEVPATYDNEGTKAHYKCSRCNKLFSDAMGTTEITENDIVISKLTPTEAPTAPVENPTEAPTDEPTIVPTEAPTEEPTQASTEAPTEPVTEMPTEIPTETPTERTQNDPTEPVAPATPDESSPKQDDTHSNDSTDKATPDEVKSDWPKTGANTQIPIWVIITIVSLVGVVGTPVGYYLQRKKRKVFRK